MAGPDKRLHIQGHAATLPKPVQVLADPLSLTPRDLRPLTQPTAPCSSTEIVFSRGSLVVGDEIIQGSLVVRDGLIAAIDTGVSHLSGVVDLEGDLLLPGLVDLHTDNLERHLQPRRGVAWPAFDAFLAHDRQMAISGVTTVFDSLCVGDQFTGRSGRDDTLACAIAAIEAAQADALSSCVHLLHLRCEVSSIDAVSVLARHIGHPLVRLVSLMDHTPGQRQWRQLDKWRQVNGEHFEAGADLDAVVLHRQGLQQQHADAARRAAVTLARAHHLPLASHDDTTVDHVAEAVWNGVSICEFPTTAIAAAAARRRSLAVVMGAPNVILGGSHSGNVSARALVREGLVDALASDYVPTSLLQACFLLHHQLGLTLTSAVALASRTPARMAGLNDRGELAVGKRADLLWVRDYPQLPVIRGGWCGGRRII